MNVTRITDFLTGKHVEKNYRLYLKTQWYDREQMDAYRLVKLKALVEHCYAHVPFYRRHMDSIKLKPADVTSLDILKEFPISSKELIKAHFDDFKPDNLDRIKGAKVSQTGGTTGNILYARNDANARSSTWAAFKRFENWMDLKQSDKSLILMGGHVIGKHPYHQLKSYVNNTLRNRIAFSPYDTSEENIRNIINTLKTTKIDFIRSYSQFLFSLAKRLKDEKLSFNVKAITTTAEPLMPEHRKLFKEVFNAECFDQYGFGEIGGVAFECNHHEGLHLTEEHVMVEANERDELMVTDLDNYALPFIRYHNADQAIFSEKPCSCGRKSKLIKKVMGRTCDYISGLNGEFLHWAYFWHLLFDSQVAEKRNLRKFQIVQPSKDILKVRLVSDPLTEEEKQVLIDNIQSRIGKIDVKFSFETEIENSASGKYRPVINELI